REVSPVTAPDARLAAIRAHATDPSYGPVPGAEVVWLCDEVGRLRGEAERPAQSIGDWSWRALSAEANAAGWKARAKAAESALTDLRADVERLRERRDDLLAETVRRFRTGERHRARAEAAERALADLR